MLKRIDFRSHKDIEEAYFKDLITSLVYGVIKEIQKISEDVIKIGEPRLGFRFNVLPREPFIESLYDELLSDKRDVTKRTKVTKYSYCFADKYLAFFSYCLS